jgi:hypothetical protein
VSGGGEIGRQAAALGHGAARCCVAAAAVRVRQRGRGGAQSQRCERGEWVREWMRVQQQFERTVRAAIFYFYFCVDGSVAYWTVRAGVEAHKRVSG